MLGRLASSDWNQSVRSPILSDVITVRGGGGSVSSPFRPCWMSRWLHRSAQHSCLFSATCYTGTPPHHHPPGRRRGKQNTMWPIFTSSKENKKLGGWSMGGGGQERCCRETLAAGSLLSPSFLLVLSVLIRFTTLNSRWWQPHLSCLMFLQPPSSLS